MLRLLGHECGQQPDAKGARRDYISREDLSFFLEGEAAARAMHMLDTDGDGRVSLAEMRDAVIAIYRERKNLAFTLKARRPRPGSALPHAYCSRMQHRHPACSPFLLSAAQAPLYAINALLVSGVRQLLALSAQHASGRRMRGWAVQAERARRPRRTRARSWARWSSSSRACCTPSRSSSTSSSSMCGPLPRARCYRGPCDRCLLLQASGPCPLPRKSP